VSLFLFLYVWPMFVQARKVTSISVFVQGCNLCIVKDVKLFSKVLFI
jgi:hypothetical protein